MRDYDLHHHGDREVGPGLVDLAVNVRLPRPPAWLRDELASALDTLAAYPSSAEAAAAVAARHGRAVDEVLVTAGAAEAFTLLASALEPRRAVVVHPQFTEPEAALRAAGHAVERVVLAEADGFVLDPALVPADADLVFVGNPTNPTSVLHPASALLALTRPGRLLVVDEAFLDAVPGEGESLAAGHPGVVVLRSLTKTWGLAGLRAGYVLAEAEVVERLRAVQVPWSVSTLAAVATVACCRPSSLEEAEKLAVAAEEDREYLVSGLASAGVPVLGDPRGPFVLVRIPDGAAVRGRLRDAGYAVRRGDTFPGLGPDHLRLAVRDRATTDAFLKALEEVR
ncbi:Rv2231c family pyridoxal phosphate-dependent protein CobC [Amycolatopsis sp. SID8362]|uniref:Rv2231c family pyridoxal phosphate-dependent protein CobC n=1 Tax=Amycolatopsis sp. SID8362 TaxID=2690346 RepID=UPI00136B0B72|nr:Rv2231c family pyridoxal phosphate-dependent protein CobC [Amycolatopsis sp. SID8362]NBH07200.1 threonine-phosphate decarboxylase [Amycolatopsis sp. SID8362]NED43896.1 threonine-phosphate decarboxylase [Amycolatopsis sp. SID8362]